MARSLFEARHLVLVSVVAFLLFWAASVAITRLALDQATSAVVNRSMATDQVADYGLQFPYKVAPLVQK